MKHNLPPATPEPGEHPPEDFEGKLTWVDNRFTELIKKAISQGMADKHQDTGEQIPQVALYNENLKRVARFNDVEWPNEPRMRSADTLECDELGRPRYPQAYLPGVTQAVSWNTASSGVEPDSFWIAGRPGQLPTREQALDYLVELLITPGTKVVPYEQAFPNIEIEYWH